MTGDALEVMGLRYAYGKNPVLRGVDFTASRGELVCVLGANGAGKTTLFRCLLRLLDGYSGTIRYDGADIRGLTARGIAQQMAYVPQSPAPTFDYSAFETVLMGTDASTAHLSGPRAPQREAAREALEAVGIAGLADRGIKTLSGGERQLVLIARSLAQRSAMIVMDEPTANLDYGNQLRVMSDIRGLTRRGYLVVTSTHSPQLALLFADRVVVLDEGVVTAIGDPAAVMDAALISRIYGVGVELHNVQTAWGTVPVLAPCVAPGEGT